MATIPSANGLTTSQYLRYLQALSLWNNLQENQRRNYPSVGEMYAYQFPQMLNTLGKQVGDVFAAQGRDQKAAADLEGTQALTGLHTEQTDSLKQQRALEQLKLFYQQDQAGRARAAETNLWAGLTPQTVPGQTFTSMEEQPPESYGGMGAEPPVTAPQTTTTPSTTTTPTLMDVIRKMGAQAADLPEKYQTQVMKSLEPKPPAGEKYVYTPQGPMNTATGATPEGILMGPAEPTEKAPPAPTRERNLETKARAQLMQENGGVEPTKDAIAIRALKLDEEFQTGLARTKGEDAQSRAEGKELPPAQRAGVVDQYGRPITGSVTPARIRDEGLVVLRPQEAQAVSQVAQIEAPFAKMLDVIEKGKLPQATGGSVYDTLQAYKSLVSGTAAQFSDPDIAAFKSAQQNILFPLMRFEGGASRQAIQELQMRLRANPNLLDTDVAAAAQLEQIAEIVESRLKSANLQPSPAMQEKLDRAHELAAKINARVSANQGKGGGWLDSLFGGRQTSAPPGFTPVKP